MGARQQCFCRQYDICCCTRSILNDTHLFYAIGKQINTLFSFIDDKSLLNISRSTECVSTSVWLKKQNVNQPITRSCRVYEKHPIIRINMTTSVLYKLYKRRMVKNGSGEKNCYRLYYLLLVHLYCRVVQCSERQGYADGAARPGSVPT